MLGMDFIILIHFFPPTFWLHHAACGILVRWPGIEPMPSAVGAWRLNHWTTRELLHPNSSHNDTKVQNAKVLFKVIDFTSGSASKEPACQCRKCKRWGLILGSRRSPGEGNGNLLQYSYLENPMDRGASWTTVHDITKKWIQLIIARTHAHITNN